MVVWRTDQNETRSEGERINEEATEKSGQKIMTGLEDDRKG